MNKTPADLLLAQVKMEPIENHGERENGIPIATHRGIFKIGDMELEVFQLDDGRRIISEESLRKTGLLDVFPVIQRKAGR